MNKKFTDILNKFEQNNWEISIVGGAVRDILAGKEANDWDLTTNAKPEDILKMFPNAFYNNRFGTVGIKAGDEIVEVTTYRKEQKYSDSRHPDRVTWGRTLEEDLARRDFTINAIAIPFKSGRLGKNPIDPYKGQEDLKKKLIRTVGESNVRFTEDALRLLRAVRFSASLGFKIERETKKSIAKNAKLIHKISGERIRDEIFKIIDSGKGMEGMMIARGAGLLKEILPELDICFAIEQKSPERHHVYDVGTHCVMSLERCPSEDVIVRFSTMLHDIGKAKVANITKDGVRTFYNHEVVGARIANDISKRLRLSHKDSEKVFKLVRWHQFSVNENQTDKAVRRFVRHVGLENVNDMMDLRIGDRLGGGLQQPESWRLKLFRKRIKDVLKKPFTVEDLKIDGKDVMKVLNIKTGPKVGKVLNKLFDEILEDDKKNTKKYLVKRIKEIKA